MSARTTWTDDQKREKMHWAARLRQTGATMQEISKQLQVPYGTLKRWLAEPQGQAIDYSMAADVLDELIQKHNMTLAQRINELVYEWVRVDTALRKTGDVLGRDYARGMTTRIRIENQLNRMTGGQWYLPGLAAKDRKALPEALETVPQPGLVLPDVYGYDRARQEVQDQYAAAHPEGTAEEQVSGPTDGSSDGPMDGQKQPQNSRKQHFGQKNNGSSNGPIAGATAHLKPAPPHCRDDLAPAGPPLLADQDAA